MSGTSPFKFLPFWSFAMLSVVAGCSSAVPTSPYVQKNPTGQPIGSSTGVLPSDGGIGDAEAGSGEARFVQVGDGAVYQSNSPSTSSAISGGNLYARSTPQSIEISLSGLTAARSEARESVERSNGTTRFSRVTYSNLPKLPQYTNHPYLIFATSGTSANGETFTVVDGNPFPVFVAAKDSIDGYSSIANGSQTYSSLISHSASGVTKTVVFQVTRKTGNVLASCSANFFSLINSMLSDQNYFAVELTVSTPSEWLGKFPISDSVFVIRFGGGGILSRVGICNVLTHRSPGDARGAITFAAQ